MTYRRHSIIGLAAASLAGLALAGPAIAQNYDTADFAAIDKATSAAQKWGNGELDANAPKVTYDGPTIIVRTSLHTPASASSSRTWKGQFDALERMSNGKIKAEHGWGATVHHVSKGFEAARDNLTDAAPCWSFYKSNSFPMMQSLFLPGISPNAAAHSLMAENLYDKYYRSEYERQNVYLGRIRATTPYIFFSKKPIGKMEDLKGQKIRSGGGIHAAVVKALGGSPISMSSGEFYSAFQRGILDVVALSDAATETFKINEIATHRTYANLSRVILEMCLNKQWVDALPADLKTVVDHWGRAAAQYDSQMTFIYYGAKARETFHKQDMKFVGISKAEEKRWQDAVQPVIDEYIQKNEAAGRPAKQLVADMRAFVEKHKNQTPNDIFMEAVKHPVTGVIPGS